MKFDTYLDRFHSAITTRKVLTNQEIKCAASDGVKPETLAVTNDNLCMEYDAPAKEYANQVDDIMSAIQAG